MKQRISEKEIQQILIKNKLTNSENCLNRIPYKHIQHFYDKIKNGDYRNITFMEFCEIKEHAGISASESKLWEYYTVSVIAICTRAAMEGGLALDDTFDIADAMLQRLETARDADELHEIIIVTATLLAYQVHQNKFQNNHYIIEQAKTYISRNIFSKIYIEDIAAYIKVHPDYLSRFFSKHEGISLHNYIMREKMQIACNLLKHSDRSISEIAQYLSIPSQSSFTSIFRKWVGTTPQKYRNETHSTSYS